MNPIAKKSATHLIPAPATESNLRDRLLRGLRSDPPTTPLDSSLYSPLLQLFIDSDARRHGRALHHRLITTGHSPDVHLATKFVIFYSKTGDVGAARKVFDGMPHRSIVSWSAMISGYAQNGRPEEALDTFSSMRRSGFKANQFTFGSALRACASLGCSTVGGQVHGCIMKSRFADDLFVQSALVDLHLKCGSVEDAHGLFERMQRRDVVLWNSLIRGHAIHGLGDEAFGLFRSMLREGLLPDHFTFGSVLVGCSGAKSLENVMQVHGCIFKAGHGNDHVTTGSLIDSYAKCRCLTSARILYDSMHLRDLISATTMITRYSQEKGYSAEALELFCEINHMGMRIDEVILCSALNVCADIASLSLGRQIHALVYKNQSDCDVALCNAVIDMYAKCGEIKDAHQAFDKTRHRNVISWTSLITGYGKHGDGNGAFTLLRKMENDGLKPNDVTFLSLISACSHSGLTSKGMDCFYTMVRKYHIHPRAEHYSCVVDLLARGGRLKEAYDFVCNMGIKLNTSLWGALLGACRVYGNTILGELSARYLFILDPERSVNYVVLANIYAQAGLWGDAWRTRKLMEKRHIKKDAGCSLIVPGKKMSAPMTI